MSKNGPKSHPGARIRQRHLSFVQTNWDLLAAEAYKNYLQSGRGILVLSDEVFVDKPAAVIVTFEMGYMTNGNEMFAADDKETKWLAEYDPEMTMLITFSRTDGGVSSYRIIGVADGIPKLAYERSLGRQD